MYNATNHTLMGKKKLHNNVRVSPRLRPLFKHHRLWGGCACKGTVISSTQSLVNLVQPRVYHDQLNFTSPFWDTASQCMGVSANRGTPVHHPFLFGIFPLNHPAIKGYPHSLFHPHINPMKPRSC